VTSRSWLLSRQFNDQSEATGLFQGTHFCDVQMDLVSDASRLLDLGGLAVDGEAAQGKRRPCSSYP
jgi:hypothetical protein